MLISVVVPVYNVNDYIDRCIQSILDQSYRDFELILVNDGSNDGSEIKCRIWKERDQRIKLISQENKGVSTARNVGIKAAGGTYITFVDADDSIAIDYLYEMVRAIREDPIDIVFCGYNYLRGGKKYNNSFFCEDRNLDERDKNELIRMALGINTIAGVKKKKATTNIGGPCMKLFRRELLVSNNIYFPTGLKRMQDTVFSIRCFLSLKRGRYIDRHLYNYIYRKNSAVNRYYPDYETISESIIKEIKAVLKDSSLQEKEIEEMISYKSVLLLYETIKLQIAHPGCPLGTLKKIKETGRVCEKKVFFQAVRKNRIEDAGISFVTLFCLAVRMRLYAFVYYGVWVRMLKARL